MRNTRSLQVVTTLLAVTVTLLFSAAANAHDANEPHDTATEAAYYLAGHGDFGVGLDDGHLHFHVHLHAGAVVDANELAEDVEYDPDHITIVASPDALALRPADAIWDASGTDANEALWVLPQHHQENLPNFGLATEELETGLFVDDSVTLSLRHLKGPGQLSIWTDDAFGQPVFLFSSHDELLSTVLPVGLHAHCNWGFTHAGIYEAVFEVSADLVTGETINDLAICTFLVAVDPVPLQALEGDVNGDGIVDGIDLVLVAENLGRTTSVWPPSDDL